MDRVLVTDPVINGKYGTVVYTGELKNIKRFKFSKRMELYILKEEESIKVYDGPNASYGFNRIDSKIMQVSVYI